MLRLPKCKEFGYTSKDKYSFPQFSGDFTYRGCMEVGMGGRFKREGIYVQTQLIHFIVQQKLTQHCKVTIPQLKKKRQWELLPRKDDMLDLRVDNKFAFILTISMNIESQMEVCQQSMAKLKKENPLPGNQYHFCGCGCAFI